MAFKPESSKPGQRKITYTIDHHKLAFETWVKTKKWKSVAAAIGGLPSSHITAKKWARSDFRCKFGCPWHGWKDLILTPAEIEALSPKPVEQPSVAEGDTITDRLNTGLSKEEELKRLEEVLENPTKTVDPEAEILKSALVNAPPALRQIARTTMDRLLHLEYLYSKTLYHMTNKVVPCEMMRNQQTGEMPPHQVLANKYKEGTSPSSYEQAAKLLVSISREVQQLKQEMGVFKKGTQESENAGPARKLPELSIGELVTIRDLMEIATETQRNVLGTLLTQSAAATKLVEKDAEIVETVGESPEQSLVSSLEEELGDDPDA